MMERAGFWRRVTAAVVDLILAQVLLLGLVALLFAATAGHVTSAISFYTSCRPAAEVPPGIALPPGFDGPARQVCTSLFFGAPTRVLFVARSGIAPGATAAGAAQVAVPVSPDGRSGIRALSLDFLYFPLFILLRWATDRFWRGSPGRRLVGIAVTDRDGTAPAEAVPGLLARRYARFAWIHLPGAALLLAVACWQVAIGRAPLALDALAFFSASVWVGVAHLVAVMAVFRHQDTFYDAPSGTAVATRVEIARAADMSARADVVPVPSLLEDLRLALGRMRHRIPWASCALVAAMLLVYLGERSLPAAPAIPAGVSPDTLVAWGAMNRELVLLLGQPYRLFTAVFAHGNAAHLVTNALALLAAGMLLEPWLGRALFVALFLCCGLGGSLASIAEHPAQMVAVGASGAALGLFAAALPLAWRVPRGNARRWLLAWPLTVCIPALLQGVQPPGGWIVDIPDHAGGEATGLLLGVIVAAAWRNGVARRPSRNAILAAGTGLAAILAVTVAVGGIRAPLQAASLVPAGELPADDDDWMRRAGVLVARYPDDPRARLGLALSEARSGEPAKAADDLDAAIALQRRLTPASADTFRFSAHRTLASQFFDSGDLDAAAVQYTAALAEQRLPMLYMMRAISEFYRRRGADAVADLRQALTIDPKQAYAILWLSIVAARTGSEDPIAATAQDADLQAWPGPIVGFFSGAKRLDVVQATAGALDLASDQHRVCEVTFYEAEWHLMRHEPEAARPLLQATVSTCPRTFIEYRAASEELAGRAGLPPG